MKTLIGIYTQVVARAKSLLEAPQSPSPFLGGGSGVRAEQPSANPHPLTPSPKGGEGEQEEQEYWQISPALRQRMTEVARQFRKEPTSSEAILWQALRGRKLGGRKMKRQQPIGPFIVDFFCSAERLVVEVDGSIHNSQQEADLQRQQLLESLGLRFVRIDSNLVENDLPTALSQISAAFLPPSLALGEEQEARVIPPPSPSLGEGLGVRATVLPTRKSGRNSVPNWMASSPTCTV